MKLIKGSGLLSFLIILSGSCFDPPEFPVVPQIEFERTAFIPAKSLGDLDTLDIYLRFKDGDGDLGFYSEKDISAPYHDVFFYQENNGQLEPLRSLFGTLEGREYHLLEIPDPSKGTLVTYRSRMKPQYASLLPPVVACPGSNNTNMKHYEYLGGAPNPDKPADGRRLLIRAADKAALDPKTRLVDSLPKVNPEYYQIRDTLYFTPNPDHYNITVEFLVKDPTAPEGFTVYDWRENYCTTFDGRFTVFSDEKSSIDGTLRYSMTSFGFKTVFSIKTLKLRVSIKDRAGHTSNVIETPEFTLVD